MSEPAEWADLPERPVDNNDPRYVYCDRCGYSWWKGHHECLGWHTLWRDPRGH